MKCNICGTIMEQYKIATHLHFIERRWRCNGCGYEDIQRIDKILPKPIIKDKK